MNQAQIYSWLLRRMQPRVTLITLYGSPKHGKTILTQEKPSMPIVREVTVRLSTEASARHGLTTGKAQAYIDTFDTGMSEDQIRSSVLFNLHKIGFEDITNEELVITEGSNHYEGPEGGPYHMEADE